MLTRRDLALGAAAAGVAGPAFGQPPPSDLAVRELLVQRIDRERQSVGVVVGIDGPQGRRVVAHGRLSETDRRRPDGRTVYEVGSITKVFTNFLFADMVRRGEIGLEDPLSRHLPAGVRVPERNGRPITLLDLATHTAGLPSFPGVAKVPPGTPEWVFPWYVATSGFHEPQLYEYLAAFELKRDPGAQWEYSNLGTTLLALAVRRRAGADYMSLLKRRVLDPLKLADSALTPTASMRRRMITGHEADMVPAPRWDLGVLTYAGGLLSTANDLMDFTAAIAPGSDSPLSASAEVMLKHRRPMPGGEQAMGWDVLRLGGEPLIGKGGLTRGCGATLRHDPATRTTVIALANSDRPPADIANHLLRPNVPVARRFVAVSLPREALEGYVGRYDAPSGAVITIGWMGRGLGIRFGSLPYVTLTPVSQTTFVQGSADVEFSGDRVSVRRPGVREMVGVRARSTAAP